MSVSLIFKIAAVGILVSVLSQVLKRKGGTGIFNKPCRLDPRSDLDCAVYL